MNSWDILGVTQFGMAALIVIAFIAMQAPQ